MSKITLRIKDYPEHIQQGLGPIEWYTASNLLMLSLQH